MGGIKSLITEIQDKLRRFDDNALLFHCKIPVERHISKKNSRPIHKRGGKAVLGKSEDLRKQEQYLRWAFNGSAEKQEIKDSIECEIQAIYHFHFGPEISRQYHLSDLSNLFEIVSDCLQENPRRNLRGVIKNDKQIKSYDGSRKFKNNNSFLEVFLIRFSEETDLTIDTT